MIDYDYKKRITNIYILIMLYYKILAGVPVGRKSSVCLICMKYRIIILIIIIKGSFTIVNIYLLVQRVLI